MVRGFFTLKIGGAAACGSNIILSCFTTVSTEKVNFDCFNRSNARCFCTGVILYDLEFLCLDQ